MQTTHSELISAIIDGDIHRYKEVVQQFDMRVRTTIATRVSDPGTIDDLVQETFYKAFKNLDRLNDPKRLGAWLDSIARNCVADHFRSQNKLPTRPSVIDEEATPGVGDKNWVWDEVEKLPTEQAKVLILRYRFSQTYEEVANQLGVAMSTVRGRIFEARKALKQRLKDKGLFP